MPACRCPWLQSGNFPSQILGPSPMPRGDKEIGLESCGSEVGNETLYLESHTPFYGRQNNPYKSSNDQSTTLLHFRITLLLFNSEMPNISDQQDREVAKVLFGKGGVKKEKIM
eukprot:TRINITY_DN12028_c0_g1_i1.p2 TRINITY_DN12028_c0_g1~~TRINITY_DN12028_c0_g1_i1.p2  ORF type:complete len:113 (+),score=20.09 TRINITY_DN12028_c0_g1_i1:138-476(+)